MNIPGHIAVALLQETCLPRSGCRRDRPTRLIFLLVASLFPDVVDKFIGYVLKLMPSGRHYAHNLLSLAASSLGVSLLWGLAAGLAWFAGYLGHLLADTTGRVPWLFPMRAYQFHQRHLILELDQLFRETLFLAAVLLLRRLGR